ncbi:hypothetical protein L226DRAFT_148030 [Lentinus tigrinus ALCF2SS1-7]|uniref:uncharacterized protein n=1 Tax=Lentinus tigrinus ALCF2SS1-7 TaxID=1328758 RepID=UPI0011663DA4|nr:hypothetical protein L226DRAFT_148030 [Lentinus tigrinus ALCF2SS1-7]
MVALADGCTSRPHAKDVHHILLSPMPSTRRPKASRRRFPSRFRYSEPRTTSSTLRGYMSSEGPPLLSQLEVRGEAPSLRHDRRRLRPSSCTLIDYAKPSGHPSVSVCLLLGRGSSPIERLRKLISWSFRALEVLHALFPPAHHDLNLDEVRSMTRSQWRATVRKRCHPCRRPPALDDAGELVKIVTKDEVDVCESTMVEQAALRSIWLTV